MQLMNFGAAPLEPPPLDEADLPLRQPHPARDMHRRGILSPDEWDAVALTFAEPVRPRAFARRIEYPSLGVV